MGDDGFLGYVKAGKDLLDIFKSVREMLPKNDPAVAKKVEAGIEKAEKELAATEAQLAKALGYKLCQCTFPPQIMLQNKELGKKICPKCRDQWPPDKPPLPEGFGRLAQARSGKNRYGRGHR